MKLSTLEEWMSKYGRDVLNVSYSYVHDYHIAQDMTQDVFLRAFSNMDSFRQESSVRTWLLSITVNRCKDYLRSWSVRKLVHDPDGIDRQISDTDVQGAVVDALASDALWQAVHRLPVKYREVLVLHYHRDLSSKEIAEILETSEQNIRTRLHRGRKMLKDLLKDGGDGDEYFT